MIFERYTIKTEKFHNLKIEDHIKNKSYGYFDRFEREQLEAFCKELNEENQASQDYEDLVCSVIIGAINRERTQIGRNVLVQLADELGVDFRMNIKDCTAIEEELSNLKCANKKLLKSNDFLLKEHEKLKQQLSDINGQLVMLDKCDNWDYDRMKHTVREIAEIIGYNGTINPKR